MKTEYPIPRDATHYFLWWDGIHIYKKNGREWKYLINGKWLDIPGLVKVKGVFSYRLDCLGYSHPLHEIRSGALK